ncbi:hypothetical protein WJX72_005782 [[Myrmecia] bisecta]|uniref:Sodium-dependent multivitamin transporter n=1 Tax=[Myrmecia] bisecta TaxID=41462 RepID=A0AAW1PAX3_9CHLO
MELRWLDFVVVGCYLAATACVGAFFSKGNNTTEDFFVGGRNLPGWAVGFSLLATTMSSVTFLAYPATSYLLDFRLLTKDFFYPVASLFTAACVAPRFRACLQSSSAYELLETRYGLACRLFAAGTYVIAQLLKLATVLYLVSLPIALLLGGSHNIVIIGTGIFVTAYSMAGGLTAVVYTDVVQAIILLLGGIATVIVIVVNLPGGLATISREGHEHNKFSIGTLEWSWTSRTIPTILCYSVVHYIGKFITFQDAVQRYLSVPSRKEMYTAALVTGTLALPMWALFYFVGVSLWAHYRFHSDAEVEEMLPDGIFPHFIMTVLPPGLSGFVISGVLAAAMSTLDSSLNAVASVITVDVIQRLVLRNRSDKVYMRCARATSLATAVLMISSALALGYMPMESMNDAHNAMQSVLAGGMTALFLLALFDSWVRNTAVLMAIVSSTLFNVYLMLGSMHLLPRWAGGGFFNTLHPYWVMPFVNVAFFVVAYLVEALIRSPPGTRITAQYRYWRGDEDLDKIGTLLSWGPSLDGHRAPPSAPQVSDKDPLLAGKRSNDEV